MKVEGSGERRKAEAAEPPHLVKEAGAESSWWNLSLRGKEEDSSPSTGLEEWGKMEV